MKPVSRISDEVSDQLLTICCRNTARAAIPLMLSILLTYFLLHASVDSAILKWWALASCTMVLVRVVLLRVTSQSNSLSPLSKRMWATVLTLMLGCSIASVLYFFDSASLFERTMLTAIMLGLCTASYSINIGYPPLLLAYIGPLLGTSSILWAINSPKDIEALFAFAVSVSILILAHTLVRNGKFMFEDFALAIESSTKLEVQSLKLSEALRHAEDAKQAAETSSQSKTRFIAAASHDLRQPVHVLNLFSGALRNAPLDTRTRDIVDNMNVAVTSLSSQLNSLLDISELDSGSIKPDIRSVDLFQLSQTLMGEMKKLAEDKQIGLINEVPHSLFVLTDSSMLSQIVRNLCGNAIKYTHAGSVRLTASESESQVVLSIVDTGIGIDTGDSDKVFEEFYQVSNHSRDKEQGLGLGLSIVERLIKTLEHDLSLKSSVGQGTTVSISMQKCTGIPTQAPSIADTADSPVTTTLPPGFWVHLVDDETAVQNSVKAFLATVGAKVTYSESSTSAMEFLKTHRPDALLIDLRLQDGDSGLAVVDSIDDPTLPIALITGESINENELAEQYPDLLMLQKPVSDEALLDLLDYMVSNEMEIEDSQPSTCPG
ncbi:MAG: ATP-binding protein [Granulosicoccus sp.]